MENSIAETLRLLIYGVTLYLKSIQQYIDMLEIKHRILAIVVLILGFLAIANGMKGQDVIQRGNAFIAVVDSSKKVVKEAKKTGYIYIDTNGVEYPVYLSSTGKAFIKKVSKKTNKEYRQYLPQITKRIAHKNTKK